MVVGAGLAAAETPVPPVGVEVLNQPTVLKCRQHREEPGACRRRAESRVQSLSSGRAHLVASCRVVPRRHRGVFATIASGVVIEHVTVDASIPEGQRAAAHIRIGEIEHALVLTDQRSWSSTHRYRASQPIRLYSMGGGAGFAVAGIQRNATAGSASFYFTVSGYLIQLS